MNLTPPKCLDTEASLLAACLAGEMGPPCSPEDFYKPSHRLICRAMHELERSGVSPDLVTVAQKLETSTDEVSPLELAEIAQTVGTSENAELYADIVKQYAVARRTMQRAVNFVGQLQRPEGKSLSDICDAFAGDVLSLADSGRKDRDYTMREAVPEFLQRLDERKDAGTGMVGLSTGISKLDRATLGMCAQDLWVIAARPSIGKTAISQQIIGNVAKKGKRVQIFSLDMPMQGLMDRFIARESRVPMDNIRSGIMDNDEYNRIQWASRLYHALDITITDVPCTELDIIRKVRKTKPDLVMLDYLQKVIPSKATGNRNTDVGMVSGICKNLAKELNIPFLLLSQLNRASERENRMPMDSDLRESGDIEADADLILFLHAPNNDKTAKVRDLFISKQRQGEPAVWTMAFQGQYQSLEPMEVGYYAR